MCHPCDIKELHLNGTDEPLVLPEFVPDDIILVFENIFNQADVEGHVVMIDSIEYIFYLEY